MVERHHSYGGGAVLIGQVCKMLLVGTGSDVKNFDVSNKVPYRQHSTLMIRGKPNEPDVAVLHFKFP